MHGNPAREDFTGMEGAVNNQHTAVFIADLENNIKTILYNNASHPVNFYGSKFLSADYPGQVRTYFREIFSDVNVLFFNGAIGDISPTNEERKKIYAENNEQKMLRVAHLIAGETLRLLQHAEFTEELALKHSLCKYDMKLRKLPADQLAWAKERMAQYKEDKKQTLDAATAHMNILFDRRFGEKEYETIDIHAAGINDFAFATVPCEIFNHFALRLIDRSPFPITSLFGLVSGDMGYCPTIEGVMGGHWEGKTSLTSRWDERAGYIIVDEASRMLREFV